MALIRCTLPASKPYPPSLYPFHAESPRALRVSTVSSAVSTLYTFSFTTFLPPLRYLPTTRRVSFARFSFPSFFLFFPLSFPFYERNIPYPARSLPLCVRPLPASHSAFTCSSLPRIMATTLPYGIGGNGIAALGFRWMWYFWFAADSFAMSFPSFVFSSSLFFFWWFYLSLILVLVSLVFRLGRIRRWIRLRMKRIKLLFELLLRRIMKYGIYSLIEDVYVEEFFEMSFSTTEQGLLWCRRRFGRASSTRQRHYKSGECEEKENEQWWGSERRMCIIETLITS